MLQAYGIIILIAIWLLAGSKYDLSQHYNSDTATKQSTNIDR